MNTLNSEVLQNMATEALERTAFVLADPFDANEARAEAMPSFYAGIQYSGSECGAIQLAASEDFIRELASSILGVEPDEVDPNGVGSDALRELANIVGGSVILNLGGVDHNFALGLPESIAPVQWNHAVDGCVDAWLSTDEDSWLLVRWVPAQASKSQAA